MRESKKQWITVSTRLSAEERRMVVVLADRRGLTPSAYVRAVLADVCFNAFQHHIDEALVDKAQSTAEPAELGG